MSLLTRVETQVARNYQKTEEARNNALYALNIAIGQLQKYAGPDARITGRADLSGLPAAKNNPYFTAVWDAQTAGSTPTAVLISGSEQNKTAASLVQEAPNPADDSLASDQVFLLGNHSIAAVANTPTDEERKRRVKLTLQPIRAFISAASSLTQSNKPAIGRYAWWVGDLGIKASLALPDRAEEVTYAPWNTLTQRRRIHQQLGSSPNYFREPTALTSETKEGFDPLAVTLLGQVRTPAQFSYLTPSVSSTAQFAHAHYHDFTTVAHAVLANTRTDDHRGLMQDLSLDPSLLGAAYALRARYSDYMEAPGSTLTDADPAYPPILDADSPRRRYQLVPALSTPSGSDLPDFTFGISPVLTDFVLQFRIFRPSANKISVRSRLYVGLWNPYTSALALPTSDALTLDIAGLPKITLSDASNGNSTTVDLQESLTPPIKGPTGLMRVQLPFGNDATVDGTRADRSSWLPGRVYGWATESGNSPSASLQFYDKNLSKVGWDYPPITLNGPTGNAHLAVTSSPISSLTLTLRTARGILATYTTPAFRALDIPPNNETWKFAFAFRLKQPSSGDKDRTWLKTFDPRNPTPPATIFGAFDPTQDSDPLDPSLYTGTPLTTQSEYLLYRIQGSATSVLAQSCYNDVPLFELPRLPHLSIGELQHLQIKASRPFAVGNSWGGHANVVFDRFFFSGLPRGGASPSAGMPNLAQDQPLPNWNLHSIDCIDSEKIRNGDNPFSSRYLLQAGGFNVNSTNVAAWRAILSNVRLHTAFEPAEIEHTGGDAFGTQKDAGALAKETFAKDPTLGTGIPAPIFFRFSQSAQETYAWKSPLASGPSDKRTFSTYAFRLGIRGFNDTSTTNPIIAPSITSQSLTTDQLEVLAREIVQLVQARATVHGPFRNLEEFLGPITTGAPSLLEKAIENAQLNSPEIAPIDTVSSFTSAGFSSLTLTQADILTSLAPYLRTRSDTFVVRSYGEVINPTTSQVEGRAWAEATLQRFPETTDLTDTNRDQPTGPFGRRFKIISFQWLSPSEI